MTDGIFHVPAYFSATVMVSPSDPFHPMLVAMIYMILAFALPLVSCGYMFRRVAAGSFSPKYNMWDQTNLVFIGLCIANFFVFHQG